VCPYKYSLISKSVENILLTIHFLIITKGVYHAETIFVAVSLNISRGLFGIGLSDSSARTYSFSNPHRTANRTPSPDPYGYNPTCLSVP
jgi:hypothetical protein